MAALLLSVGWIVFYVLLARFGVVLLPVSFARTLTLPTYLAGVQIITLSLGLIAVRALSKRDPALPRDLLPRCAGSDAGCRLGPIVFGSLLLAPLAYCVCHSVGMWLAFDTLIEELAEKGRQAVQQQTGELGRQARVDSLYTLLPFTVLIAPLGEEILFRGALYGSVLRFFRRSKQEEVARKEETGGTGPRELLVGPFVAVAVTTLVFGLLHADTPGGLGILRVASATLVGFSCGLLRLWSGGLWAPLALHAGYNFLSLGTLRSWFTTAEFPTKFGLPTLLLPVAALGLVLFLVFQTTDVRLRKGSSPLKA